MTDYAAATVINKPSRAFPIGCVISRRLSLYRTGIKCSNAVHLMMMPLLHVLRRFHLVVFKTT
jgi:hypothetical protein